MAEVDYAERMAQIRTHQQRLMLDGNTESLLPEIDPIRSIKNAMNSCTVVQPAVAVVYTVPAGRAIVCDNVTLTNREVVANTFLIYNGLVTIDEVQLDAGETMVLPKRYRADAGNTLNFSCSVFALGSTMSADFIEYPLADKARTPPS